MAKKITIILSCLFIISGFFSVGAWLVYGQEGTVANNSTLAQDLPEIQGLNQEIQKKKEAIEKLKDKASAYQKEILNAQSKKTSLQNQLSVLDNRLADAQLNIERVRLNMDQLDLEIRKTNLEIREQDKNLALGKEELANALKLLYQQGDKSDLEIILTNDNFSDYLDQVKYLESLNSGITDNLEGLRQTKANLENSKNELLAKQESLNKLETEMRSSQGELQDEQQVKNYILDQTRSSEKEYQRLLSLAKKEQQEASAEIVTLERTIRQKLAGGQLNALQSSGLLWPVAQNTITAYFHDPGYPFRNIFEHPAIDIRAGQGTQIKAADNGYVGRVKFLGDKSYAYIMIVHSNGLATVYGHVSAVYVAEDDYVAQGQIIGLTGGAPGTIGAGSLTTGSHMHFEVRLDGIPVNPLEYLP